MEFDVSGINPDLTPLAVGQPAGEGEHEVILYLTIKSPSGDSQLEPYGINQDVTPGDAHGGTF
ncbi:hypothetical protein [Desulfosoma caldarium]|uniref:hypothetical protein n=1 Tax=Desulfosoma caldarium TaxID=610254 RepID=UPI000F46A96D|nr:hypothetical protein [Desulfosoma caldarium]